MSLDLANDTTLTDALAKLDAAEAAETKPPPEAFVQTDPPEGQPEGAAQQSAPKPGEEATTPNPEISQDGTPAAAEPEAEPTETKSDDKGSKFARDRARRDDSWKALNAEKETFKSEREKFESERAQFQREREQFTQRQARSSQRHTPEEYEAASVRNQDQAGQLELQAKGLEAQAHDFEDDGKYTEAQSAKERAKELREQAAYARGVARQLKDHAAHLRSNPDPTVEQLTAKNTAAIREYTVRAAEQWPDIAKNGSALQKLVAKNIAEARQAGLDENEFPVVRWYSARMAALETDAARVPDLEKRLGAAEAKVKELEALTAPGGGQSAVQSQSVRVTQSDDEEGAALRALALQM